MEVYSTVQYMLGRKTAGNISHKYILAYKRECTCDGCINGVSQNMSVSVLPHSMFCFVWGSIRRIQPVVAPKSYVLVHLLQRSNGL